MKNSKLKKWVFLGLGGVLLTIMFYSIYTKIYGVNSQFIIHNNSRSVFYSHDKYEYVDFRIIINDEEVFYDSIQDGLHTEKRLDVNLNLGYNRIEVYSDSSKQYDIKSEYVFFKKLYRVSFTRATEGIYRGGEYFSLSIDRN